MARSPAISGVHVVLHLTWEQNEALSNLLSTARKWAYVEGVRKDLEERELELLHDVRHYERAFDLPERED
jgi:hypothetical protein